MELNWQNAGGKLPEGWTVAPLRDFLVNEKSVSVGVMYPGKHDENGVPLIKVGDVKNGKVEGTPESRISLEVDEEYKRTRLSGDELLITLVGNPGECVIVQPHMKGWNAARALAVLRLKDPDTRQWLNMVLQSRPLKHIIDSRLNTTVQKTLNLKDVKELPIPTPNIGIHTLCRYYYDLDQKITLNRQINQTLEQMAQTLFKSWFVDFDPVIDNALDAGNPIPDELQHRAEARKAVRESEGFKPLPDDVRQLFPDAFEESELGWVPKGWVMKAVSDALTINPKVQLSKGQNAHFVDMKALPTSGYSIEEVIHKAFSGGAKFEQNDVLLARITPCLQNGKTGFVDFLGEGEVGFGSTEFIVLRGDKDVHHTYIACLARHEKFRQHAMQSMVGSSGRQRVQNSCFDDYFIAVPTDDVMKKFAQMTKPSFDKFKANTAESIALAELRDTLLPKLISGELRLDDVELAVEQEAVSAEQQNGR